MTAIGMPALPFGKDGLAITTLIDNEGTMWFQVTDVLRALGSKDERLTWRQVRFGGRDHIKLVDVPLDKAHTGKGMREFKKVAFTDEYGVMHYLGASRMPVAQDMRQWVITQSLAQKKQMARLPNIMRDVQMAFDMLDLRMQELEKLEVKDRLLRLESRKVVIGGQEFKRPEEPWISIKEFRAMAEVDGIETASPGAIASQFLMNNGTVGRDNTKTPYRYRKADLARANADAVARIRGKRNKLLFQMPPQINTAETMADRVMVAFRDR